MKTMPQSRSPGPRRPLRAALLSRVTRRAPGMRLLLLAVLCAASSAGAQPGAPPTSTAAAPSPLAAATCEAALSEANTRSLFDAIKAMHTNDGCPLEDVQTDRSTMKVTWKKNEQLLEAIQVIPTACAPGATARGKVLSLAIPASVEVSCPQTVTQLRALIQSESFNQEFENLGSSDARLSMRARTAIVAGTLAAFALAIFLRRSSRRSSEAAPPLPPGGGLTNKPREARDT